MYFYADRLQFCLTINISGRLQWITEFFFLNGDIHQTELAFENITFDWLQPDHVESCQWCQSDCRVPASLISLERINYC